MLARRLKAMVDVGLLTKRRYSGHRRGTSTS
jgi:DNA-binding HxlR family transcriptional regulator